MILVCRWCGRPAASLKPVACVCRPGERERHGSRVTISKMPSPPLEIHEPARRRTDRRSDAARTSGLHNRGAVAGPDQTAQRLTQVRKRQSLNSART
jgi:hypothetical protein